MIFSVLCNVLYIIFCSSLLFSLAIVLSILSRFTASDYPFAIFRRFFKPFQFIVVGQECINIKLYLLLSILLSTANSQRYILSRRTKFNIHFRRTGLMPLTSEMACSMIIFTVLCYFKPVGRFRSYELM